MLSVLVLGLTLTASAGPATGSSGLAAAAASSGRPRECAASAHRSLSRAPTVWEQARSPNLSRYCDLLARAQAQLASDPEAAKSSALEADKLMPSHAGPQIVLARAALALRSWDESAKSFDRALELDPRSAEDAPTMHDLARALVRSGQRERALVVYRALVPRVDLLATAEARIAVLLEAAHAAMTPPAPHAPAADGAAGAKPDAAGGGGKLSPSQAQLDEAIAYLREARQRPTTQLAPDVLLSLALALDRAGEHAQSDAALADALRAGARPSSGPPTYAVGADDQLALHALALELDDRAGAQKAWEAFLAGEGGRGPWATAARARLDAMRKGGARPKPAPTGKERSPKKP